MPAGASSLCIFWGPVLGARVVSYRTAVLLGVACQIVGNVALGPTHLTPYAGLLKKEVLLTNSPELVLYALLCVAVILPICHIVAYWQRMPLSPTAALGNIYIC